MTKIHLTTITTQLSKWREERHISTEQQKEVLLYNLLEKVLEFTKSTTDYDKIDTLCDLIVLSFNALNENETNVVIDRLDRENYYFEPVPLSHILYNLFSFQANTETDNLVVSNGIYDMIRDAYKIIYTLGYDPYNCLLEKIKEISSKTGYYDEKLKKFVVELGTYDDLRVVDKSGVLAGVGYDNIYDTGDYWNVSLDNKVIKVIRKWNKATYIKDR